MKKYLNTSKIEDYKLFLKIKSLPRYRIVGHEAWFPDEYASAIGISGAKKEKQTKYVAPDFMFDYQKDITALAIRKQKFAVFAQCGLGKTQILLDFARHIESISPKKCILIVSPLMVIEQTMKEAKRFYGDSLKIEQIACADLPAWLHKGVGIGITNYESMRETYESKRLVALILDESSTLKAHYSKWGARLIHLGKGLPWKLCLTGTPAPNDRIEYANHAVFLDAFPTVNSFLAKFFVNRGQTDNRWELKPHAMKPFYLALSDFSIFLENPATYGWKDNVNNIPPIHVHIHDVDLTSEQREAVIGVNGDMFGHAGGITSRSTLSQIAKGITKTGRVETRKPDFIRNLVDSWPDESTIIWCIYNKEQEHLETVFPEAGSIAGATPYEERSRIINDFKSGKLKTLISKPSVLGFGLNLQIATRQVFSGLQDSYEDFHQAVKRSNRIGSTKPLNVHIPVTDVEYPMIETVLRKAKRVQKDTEEQEAIFKEYGGKFLGLEVKNAS